MVNELCSQSIPSSASLYLHYLLQYPLMSAPTLMHTHTDKCTHSTISGFSQVLVSLPTGHTTYRNTLYQRAHYVCTIRAFCVLKH